MSTGLGRGLLQMNHLTNRREAAQPFLVAQICPPEAVVHPRLVAHIDSESDRHPYPPAVHRLQEAIGLINGPGRLRGDVHLLVVQSLHSLVRCDLGQIGYETATLVQRVAEALEPAVRR